jgi:hypothetical protein
VDASDRTYLAGSFAHDVLFGTESLTAGIIDGQATETALVARLTADGAIVPPAAYRRETARYWHTR